MAVTTRKGSNSGFALGERLSADQAITNTGPPSTAGTTQIANDADVTSTGAITLTEYNGVGTIEVTLSTAGAGVITVAGNDNNGNAQTDTLTFAATDTSMETTNNYVFEGLTVTVSTAFGAGTTADIDANTIDAAGMYQKYFSASSLDLNEDANVVESNEWSSSGADSADEIGQFWGHMNVTKRVSVEDHLIFAYGEFNNATASTQVPAQAGGTLAIGANATTDITAPSGGLNHPSRLQLTFATAPANDTSIQIRGNIKIGVKGDNQRYRTETINFDGTTTVFTTNNYWDGTQMDVVNDTANALNATLSWDSGLWETTMSISRQDPIFDGWDVQATIGGVPRVGRKVVPNQMSITATPSGIDLEMQCVASQVTWESTIDGGNTRQLALTKVYPEASQRRFAPWAGVLKLGTITSKYTNFTFTFNRNYEADEAVDGNRFRTDIDAQDNRQVTIQPTARYLGASSVTDVINEWQEIFREEGARLPVEYRMYSWDKYGKRQQVIYNFPSCQLNESPQTVVNDGGTLDQPLGMKALTDSSNPSEITLTAYTENRVR